MSSAAPVRCESCPVRDQAVCAALSEAERSALARIGVTRDFARGETIFAAGDDSVACATLISGAAKLSAIDAEGTERIVAIVHPSGFLGQLFAAQVDHHAVALTDSRLCLFPRGGFEAVMADHPALLRSILDRTLADLAETRALVDLIGRRSSRGRVAGLILLFARAASEAPCHSSLAFELPLTRGEMAALLGLTIETVSRQLGQLEADGLIARSGPRGLIVRYPAGLEAAAG